MPKRIALPKGVVLPESGFVRLPTVLAVFPISASGWWKGIQDKKYPAGVKLSPRVTAWRVEDLRALLDLLGKQ
ncbi:MAG: AlpA family phage regulatory protein [Polaromonas sp.]|uniref:helix-turn-helix transcriptional regulator n=1 Tax=Polaromonas sp. TaxID=1869339 RepID=UPI00271CC4B2|nr:AlpA family phage regulatory protein [Polaromonas sp.]MDO9114973.1 AlpA family phage regulatory protein [Polaromonas sp.]MDP1885561.1 AlpA family phage regulatory protein [Polaromonas sp.]